MLPLGQQELADVIRTKLRLVTGRRRAVDAARTPTSVPERGAVGCGAGVRRRSAVCRCPRAWRWWRGGALAEAGRDS